MSDKKDKPVVETEIIGMQSTVEAYMLEGTEKDDTVMVDWGLPGEADVQQEGQLQK